MNAIELARQAYAPTHTHLKSERTVEAQLFAEVTAALTKSIQNRETHFPAFVSALHRNRQMWITLAVDLADAENALPITLRAQLISLAQFVGNHTQQILLEQADPEALIEINTSIMRGLSQAGRN